MIIIAMFVFFGNFFLSKTFWKSLTLSNEMNRISLLLLAYKLWEWLKRFSYHNRKIPTFMNTNKNYPYAAAIKPIIWDISFKWLISLLLNLVQASQIPKLYCCIPSIFVHKYYFLLT